MYKKIIIIVCSIILFSIQKINAQLDLSFNNPVLQTGDSSRIMKGESTYGTGISCKKIEEKRTFPLFETRGF